MKILQTLLFLCILVGVGQAGDITSVKSGKWSDPTVWSTGAVPTAADNVTITGWHVINFDLDSGAVNNLTVGCDTNTSASTTNGWRTTDSTTVGVKLAIYGNLKVYPNMVFYSQTSKVPNTQIPNLVYIQGNLENYGSKFDCRNGSAGSTLGVVNFIFFGSQNSTVTVTAYSTANNEFNGVTFNKTGNARIILANDMVCAGSSSAAVALDPYIHFYNGIVETGTHAFVSLATTSATMDTGNANCYILGTMGRAMSNSAGKSNYFYVGDSAGYRPASLKSATGGTATGHFAKVSCISGNANTGASVLDAAIDKVSEVRYYKVSYSNTGAGAASMAFDAFRPSYEAQDGVTAGNTDLRVAYSTNERANWTLLKDTYPDVTSLGTLPKYYSSDTMATAITLNKDADNLYFAFARLTGTTTNSLVYTPTAVRVEAPKAKNFLLNQNYPNPFNPSTKISYQLPSGSVVTLKVYDVIGNEVATLVNEFTPAGSYEVNFNASKLSSGVYYYQLRTGSFVQTNKMLLVK